jgi:hypothetical protein
LERKTDISICTYSDSKFSYEVDEQAEGMMRFIEDMALMDGRVKDAQETPNLFKTWMTSVGEYAFLVFKSVAKKTIQFTVQLDRPKNLELLSKTSKVELKLTPA